MSSDSSRRARQRSQVDLEGLERRTLLSSAQVATVNHPAAASVAGGVRALMNLTYPGDGGRPQKFDLYVPAGPAPAGGRPVVLALPGGGWRWVRRGDLGASVAQLAKFGYVVAVADYTYSSGAPGSSAWPADINDVRNAVRYLKANAGRYGIDPNRFAVWGESAGGHLANLLGTDPDPTPAAAPRPGRGHTLDGVSAKVQAVVDFYGPTDLTKLYAESSNAAPYLITYLGGRPDQFPDRYRDASPVTHVNSTDPPFLIEQGIGDTTVPPDQAAELATALKAAGVPYHVDVYVAGHGFRFQPQRGLNILPNILAFLDKALNHGGAGIS